LKRPDHRVGAFFIDPNDGNSSLVAGRKMQPTTRFPQLDAVRGLAALSVFWGHAFMMLPAYPGWFEQIHYTPLFFFCDGRAVVTLFFVLSGLVLNLKYVRAQTLPRHWVSGFIINRIFRIYPAFLLAILLSLFLRFFIYDASFMAGMSDQLPLHWQNALNIPELLRLATLVAPNIHPDQIDAPMWSLVFEMRISLGFPLIIFWLAQRRNLAGDLCFLVVVYAVGYLLKQETIRWVPLFVLGAVCAKHFEVLRSRLGNLNPARQALWLLVALFLYEAGTMAEKYLPGSALGGYVSAQLTGLGAAGIILASVSFKKIAAWLAAPLFHFIGCTSYSFYLIHALFQMAPAPLVYQLTGSWLATWLTALALTYLVAWLMFKLVEKPMIKKGHAVADRFSQRPNPQPEILAK
jgi:peptidoglycan/LPS O-acetylase OafA/YrhL